MADFESLVQQQQDHLHRISRTVPNLKKKGQDKLTRPYLDTTIGLLDAKWREFASTHTLLVGKRTKELAAHAYFKEDVYQQCEEVFLETRAEVLNMRDLCAPAPSANTSISGDGTRLVSSIARSLPKITLPKFAGDYQSWSSFRDLFQSMVGSNDDIPAVEKFHHLKSSLVGEASRHIANISVTADNFGPAWDALVARYENKRAIVSAHLDKLFAIAPIARKSAHDLKTLISTVKEALGGLGALGAPIDSWDFILVHFITRRLDPDTREAWELRQGTTLEPATFRELDDFLDGRIRALEVIAPCTTGKSVKATKSLTAKTASHANAATASANKCACCDGSHYIAFCREFAAKPVDNRREIVVSKRLCLNCLGPHPLTECKSAKRCRFCGGNHHSLVHRASATANVAALPGSSVAISDSPASGSFTAAAGSIANSYQASGDRLDPPAVTFLMTARVRILCPNGQAVEARALVDPGSELSFIRESLAQILRLRRYRAGVPLLGIGAQSSYTARGALMLRLQSCCEPTVEFNAEAYILPRLTTRTPVKEVLTTSWTHLRDLPLADPSFCKPGDIDLLLGADVYRQLFRDTIRCGAPHQPVATKTSLGWVVLGPLTDPSNSADSASSPSRGLCGSQDSELDALVRQFWKQEETAPASSSSMLTEEEAQCEAHFLQTHQRSSSGRYIVRLPFRSTTSSLGTSRPHAERVLRRMQQKFASNHELATLYSDFLQEYETLGHMVRASAALPQIDTSFYLPHHGVLRHSSSTSKLRVVFNGSASSSSGSSLNDCLHIGPKLQQDLADVLLRWRRYTFVFLADVEKMYRQIEVHPNDRDFQRILWSKEGPPQEYQLCTVTYGLSCAPYLALRVLQQLADDEGSRFPLADPVLRNEMYVDDVLSGADTLSLAQSKAEQVHHLLMAGGFRLHKWMANEPAVLSTIENASSDSPAARGFSLDQLPRALGLAWDPRSDSFVFQLHLAPSSSPLTKRVVLSRVAQLFDPLGWIAPVIIVAKIFLQGLWKLQVGWDQPLSAPWAQRWLDFETELNALSSISLPRWLGISSSALMEIHGFSDASNDALGAVLYLRSLSSDGRVRVSLIVGKSRVAPLKRQTIPRLELSAALLLARLLSRIRRVLQLEHAPVHLWTDSSVVLAWLRGHPSRWKDFVANRVIAINDLASDAHWHHIAGMDNPADCASRGLSPRDFRTHHLWWTGPPWLSNQLASWTTSAPPPEINVDLEERPARALQATTRRPSGLWEIVFRYSKLTRLVRITAWLFRAAARFRGRAPNTHSLVLTPQELLAAEKFWVLQTQRAHFTAETATLSQGAALPRSHPFLRLTPFLDHEGILRLGGRLQNSLLDPDAKHPILLPRDSFFSHLVIDDAHCRTMHGGVQLVLATLRRKFWILGGRAPISSFIRRCIRCVRYRAAAAKELMGQLPPSRVAPSRPFLHSGVDYAGPFIMKSWPGRCTRRYKAFLVIFVCMATSAVHLELATDYSTAGFLAAFKRFCSRRGICATLASDCGTNLVGADAELRRMFASASKEVGELANLLASDGTRWLFNPPAAPHMGGKWEAAVKSTKFHLRRVVGDTLLTYEEFTTVLTQIEAVLNSRPICPISDDPSDTAALTPAHFLTGDSLSLIPEPSLSDVPLNRLSRWQQLRLMVERFWQRWSTEYLQRLHDVAKWQHPTRQITIGSLVLVRDERYPPAKWPLGRVIETHAGKDGLIRVVTVRTASSTLKRPIVKLCLLPIPA